MITRSRFDAFFNEVSAHREEAEKEGDAEAKRWKDLESFLTDCERSFKAALVHESAHVGLMTSNGRGHDASWRLARLVNFLLDEDDAVRERKRIRTQKNRAKKKGAKDAGRR